MAKCNVPVSDWALKAPEKDYAEKAAFVVENLKTGEELLRRELEDISIQLHDIAHDHVLIAQSANNGEKFDCFMQVQDEILLKLHRLNTEISTITQTICKSNYLPVTKHRYFIMFSCGVIGKLQQLLQIAGRISELDPNVYLTESISPFISEESVTIHTLTAIWSAVIEIMFSFCEPAKQLFKEHLQNEENNFLVTLEFSTAGAQHAKLLLMDLMITSWMQFNRLVKYEDLLQKVPFLCHCHCKLYLLTLKRATNEGSDQKVVSELISSFMDDQYNLYCIETSKQPALAPREFCHRDSDQFDLAYFIVWHLCSLNRIATDALRPLILACQGLLEKYFEVAAKQFIPKEEKPLSTHQEERFRLLFAMLNHWCEKSLKSNKALLVIRMLSFFERNWEQIGDKYFDEPEFRVDGLTVFQLFTKLVDEITPLYTKEGQPAPIDESNLSKSTKDLRDVWNRLLTKKEPKPVIVPEKACS